MFFKEIINRILDHLRPELKYINFEQAKLIGDAILPVFKDLNQYGHLQGGGIHQEEDGEIVIIANYLIGTITKSPPLSYKGFRIKIEERQKAYLC